MLQGRRSRTGRRSCDGLVSRTDSERRSCAFGLNRPTSVKYVPVKRYVRNRWARHRWELPPKEARRVALLAEEFAPSCNAASSAAQNRSNRLYPAELYDVARPPSIVTSMDSDNSMRKCEGMEREHVRKPRIRPNLILEMFTLNEVKDLSPTPRGNGLSADCLGGHVPPAGCASLRHTASALSAFASASLSISSCRLASDAAADAR